MKSINLLNKTLLENKRVLLRGDLDCPLENGKIVDSSRLDSIRDTLDYLVRRACKVVLVGHLGRPDGMQVDALRAKPVADYLKSVGYDVRVSQSILGPDAYESLKQLQNGQILLLENLRFDKREEENSEAFAKELSAFGDLYVNDCFSSSHRNHASFCAITKFLPSYAGLRLDKEVESLARVVSNPEKPLVAIFGGIKLETKLPAISKFLSIADYVLLGGRLGLSYEGDNNYKVLVPVDYAGDSEDIGPKTISMFQNIIRMAKTVIWNGPMGKIEHHEFLTGTREIAECIVGSKAFSVVGGGDTILALDKLNLRDKMGFVSMGGGAMLEFIEGKRLPGLVSLSYYN